MKKTLLISIVWLMSIFTISAQTFTNINANLLDVTFSSVAWGDYDSDGDLDLVIIGMDDASTYHTSLYRNDGNDQFTEITGLPFNALAIGDVAWADYDNDGDLDLLMMGAANGSAFIGIYENKGNDDFTATSIDLEQAYDGSVSWADYNNDGYLDILYTGFHDASSLFKTFMYKNNQDGTFEIQEDINIPGTDKGVIKWADIDGDEDMDFLITGLDTNGVLIANLYKNLGNENFILTENSFIGVWLGDAAWGDYDMDGDPDLILSGFNFSGRICKIYQNNGLGGFSVLEDTPFPGISHSSTEWGDYDNDGDLDLFLCGVDEQSGWIYYAAMYVNEGNGNFVDSGLTFPLAFWGESNFGDYDGDGDLDLILTGYDGPTSAISAIYRNNITSANIVPEAPEGLSSVVEENNVSLSWLPATDAETPSAGLTYNAYLYKQDGDTIMPAMSMLIGGKRLLPENGNVSQDTSWNIKGLAGGTYFWSVQAIDNSFDGSAFATENSFVIIESAVGQIESSEWSVYPNPTSGSITINVPNLAGNAKYSIENIQGRTVLTDVLNTSKTQINLSDLSPGIYFLKIYIGLSRSVEKISVR